MSSQSLRTPRRFLKSFSLVLAATLIGLLLAEGLVRLLRPQPLTVPWADKINGVLVPRPNVRGREFVPDTYDVTISFNSQRFRGQREYSTQPGNGIIRLAMLGDSVTFGNGANDDQTYPSQLESILRERLHQTAASRVPEVINAGIGGTGTAEQALWYENWVAQFTPHLVVLNIFCNDVDGDLQSGLFILGPRKTVLPRTADETLKVAKKFLLLQKVVGSLPGYVWLAQHSQSFNLMRNAIGGVLDNLRTSALAKPSVMTPFPEPEEQFRQQGLALMAGEVVWLDQRVKASGARLVVAFLPCRETIYPSLAPWAEEVRWKSARMVERLQELTSKENIPFTNLTLPVRERAHQLNQPLYYNGRLDTHPNPEGYRVIAELVAQFLFEKELILLPTDHRPDGH